MTPLVLLLLAQSMNVQPPSTFRCDGGISCSTSGRTLYISGSASSSGGGKVGEAYAADASVYAVQFITNPADCGGGQYATAIAANGDLTCSTPPSGSGNGGVATVSFGDGVVSNEDSAELVVSASWVTASSAIVFTPACSQVDGGTATVEECRVVFPECAVTAIVPSTSFTMQCRSESGGFGQYPVSYLGL